MSSSIARYIIAAVAGPLLSVVALSGETTSEKRLPLRVGVSSRTTAALNAAMSRPR
jgi:hypothetical protein